MNAMKRALLCLQWGYLPTLPRARGYGAGGYGGYSRLIVALIVARSAS